MALKNIQPVNILLKILLVALVLLICDLGAGTILRKFYFSQNSGEGYQTTYSIDSTKAEMLVFGSSRAEHHYIPDILEHKLNTTCYNTGRDGNFILYNYAIFKAILKRYTPRLILIDITPGDFEYFPFEYGRLSNLLPYYRSHPEVRNIIDLRGPSEKIKHISSIYPFNSLIFQISIGNLKSNKERRPNYKGYVPLDDILEQNIIDTALIGRFPVDNNKIMAVKDIISLCRQKNIELVFIYSPIWVKVDPPSTETIISRICQDQKVRYLNLSNLPLFLENRQYFAQIDHLNDAGAKVFSAMLADTLLKGN